MISRIPARSGDTLRFCRVVAMGTLYRAPCAGGRSGRARRTAIPTRKTAQYRRKRESWRYARAPKPRKDTACDTAEIQFGQALKLQRCFVRIGSPHGDPGLQHKQAVAIHVALWRPARPSSRAFASGPQFHDKGQTCQIMQGLRKKFSQKTRYYFGILTFCSADPFCAGMCLPGLSLPSEVLRTTLNGRKKYAEGGGSCPRY